MCARVCVSACMRANIISSNANLQCRDKFGNKILDTNFGIVNSIEV